MQVNQNPFFFIWHNPWFCLFSSLCLWWVNYGVLPIWVLFGFNDSREFSNSQKWLILLTTILFHKRLWKSNELALIHSWWVGYNLSNQSHSAADFSADGQQVSRGYFCQFYFDFYIGRLFKAEENVVVDCTTPMVLRQKLQVLLLLFHR